MEKSIDDIEFRKLVLKMYDEGYTRNEIPKKLNISVWLFDNIKITFDNNRLDINAKLNNNKFTKEEDIIILENMDEKDVGILIKKLNRSYYKILKRKNYLKKTIKYNKYNHEKNKEVNSGKPITEEEIEFVREAINNGDSIKDIAIALGRSKDSIYYVCYKNKIKKEKEVVQDGYKRCCRCKKIKSLDEFYKNASKKDGYYRECKECYNQILKNNRERKKNGK